MSAEPEFDQFAKDYEDVLDRATQIGGEETGHFASYKIDIVHDRVGGDGEGLTILDFGCGVGQSTPYFAERFPKARLLGTDVSSQSIAVAESRHGPLATYTHYDAGDPLPYADASVDVAFTSCVFHHIPHDAHPAVLAEVRRVLKPGGRFFVFEHNPLNPLTMKVVNDCPFDENAVLIRAPELRRRLEQAGFEEVRARFCLFVPGQLRWLRPLESALTWCPAGAQYYVEGRRGTSS
jgi:ubiquinone/menaquinone biosynthesis C-methylase UbiE